MFFVQLALKNLTRNLRRTALSMVAVIAGVWVLILGKGFIGGMDENIIRGQIDSLSGHVLLRPAAYPSSALIHPLDGLFSLGPDQRSWLDANTEAWTERILFSPRAIHGPDAIRVRGIAYDPVRDPVVFPRDTWRYTAGGPQDDGVLISASIARVLELETGEAFLLECRTPAGAINALQVKVADVYATGNPALDRFGMFVPMPLAAQLLHNDGRVSHVVAVLPNRDDAAAFSEQLAVHGPPGTETSTWHEDAKDMLAVQQIRRRALDILVVVLMGMSATSIANTILMAAYERIREIGTLRAMGMTRAGVLRMFVLEGAMMGLLGGLLGACLGGGMVAYWSAAGIDLSSMLESGGAGTIAMSSMLYLDFSEEVIVGSVLFGLVVAIAASIWPALAASRMQPADAVRAD
jgi:putative ABC transport system permease protein